jgi:hypothetical protein
MARGFFIGGATGFELFAKILLEAPFSSRIRHEDPVVLAM